MRVAEQLCGLAIPTSRPTILFPSALRDCALGKQRMTGVVVMRDFRMMQPMKILCCLLEDVMLNTYLHEMTGFLILLRLIWGCLRNEGDIIFV